MCKLSYRSLSNVGSQHAHPSCPGSRILFGRTKANAYLYDPWLLANRSGRFGWLLSHVKWKDDDDDDGGGRTARHGENCTLHPGNVSLGNFSHTQTLSHSWEGRAVVVEHGRDVICR